MTREELQEELQKEALELFKKNDRIALQWCTGLGKSKAAIDMANYINDKKEQEEKHSVSILLVVAESAHKDNWEKEFKKWGLKPSDVIIECYASLKKYAEHCFDLIIFDEAHHLGSDLRLNILSTLKASHVILLSATLPYVILDAASSVFGKIESHEVNLKYAIEHNILPKPKVYLIPLKLADESHECTIVEEWGKSEKRKVYKCNYYDRWKYLKDRHKYPDATVEITCTPQQKYEYYTSQFEYWRGQYFRTNQDFAKNKWLQAGSKRKRFLGECKTKHVGILLDKLRGKRYICFCSSIEQAEYLGGDCAIHSQMNNPLSVLDKFNSKQIDYLFAVGMLQEGQNLKGIEAGVIVQLDGQERPFIQKFGRSMRAKGPVQFIFYYEGTRDTEYLEKVLEGINKEYITEIRDLKGFVL